MEKKITIIGAGSFGSAIAQIFSDKKKEVLIYTIDEVQAKEINLNKTNKYYFENLVFSNYVRATTSLSEALSFSNYIIIALPSSAVREISSRINKIVEKPKMFINVSKGLEPGTNKMISEIMEEEIASSKIEGIVILSGPSHAEEIIKRDLTALVAVSLNYELAKKVQYLFSNKYIRIYTSTDYIGVQIGATVKNIIAIASGIVYGMGYGDNTRALLITRGLAEMVRYGRFKGAKMETFFGLAGIGDLIVTATSYHSRNFQIGHKIGEGIDPKTALKESKTIVEGVRAIEAVYFDAKNNSIEMPITNALYKLFFEDQKIEEIMEEIINRDLKSETL